MATVSGSETGKATAGAVYLPLPTLPPAELNGALCMLIMVEQQMMVGRGADEKREIARTIRRTIWDGGVVQAKHAAR